jgi:hypothetical protein
LDNFIEPERATDADVFPKPCFLFFIVIPVFPVSPSAPYEYQFFQKPQHGYPDAYGVEKFQYFANEAYCPTLLSILRLFFANDMNISNNPMYASQLCIKAFRL